MTDHDSTEPLSPVKSVKLMRKMSHDMRAPMAAIIGTADLLLTDGCDELTARQKRSMDRIRRNGVRLVAILDDLMTYVKADAGEYVLEIAPFDPCVLVTRALAEVQPTAAEHGLHCKSTIAQAVPA